MKTKKQIMRHCFISCNVEVVVFEMNKFVDENNIDQVISITEYKIDDPYKINDQFVLVIYYYEPDKRFTDDYRG